MRAGYFTSRIMPAVAMALASGMANAACSSTLYLTFATGTMRHAELIAEMLAKHKAKATFFVANEKTLRGDHALDQSWAEFWQARVAEGHSFGSHTWRHGSFRKDQGKLTQYRLMDGQTQNLDSAAICAEVRGPDIRFRELTGRVLDPLWRAPGGRTTPQTQNAAQACGYRHVGWAPAGFLGDELPSEGYPNALLVERALKNLKDGDIVMAHLGIWSRKEPFAPALDELLGKLEARGFCFASLAPAN